MRTIRPALLLALSACAALVSPRPAPGQDPAPSPPPGADGASVVSLNHLYLVVDSATYRAIHESALLRERLAATEARTTRAGDGRSWTGYYLYGRSTYFEFFSEGEQFGPRGTSGIAYGVDREGGIEEVRRRLSALPGATVTGTLSTRLRGADTIPWFHLVAADHGDSTAVLTTWAMEYHPGYLPRWNPGLGPSANGISRRHHRAREFAPDRHLDDVVGVTVALDEPEAGRFLRELATLGFDLSEEAGARVASGADVSFRVVPATTARRGIVELRLSLLRPWEGERVHRIGSSTLAFHPDGTATWSF